MAGLSKKRLSQSRDFIRGADAPTPVVSVSPQIVPKPEATHAPAPTPEPEPAPVPETVTPEETSEVTAAPPRAEAPRPKRQPKRKKSTAGWEDLADDGPVVQRLSFGVNERQYEQLQYLSKLEDRSVAKILTRLLGPALEEAAKSGRV